MGVKISGKTLTTTSAELIHEPSGARIKTVAPVDNGGDGSSFSPTDLCAASLGACASLIMNMFAKGNGIEVQKIEFNLEKIMQATPRKISIIAIKFEIFSTCSESDFAKIVQAGKNCPVLLALKSSVDIQDEYRQVQY